MNEQYEKESAALIYGVVKRKIKEVEEFSSTDPALANYLKMDISKYVTVLEDICEKLDIEEMEYDEEAVIDYSETGKFDEYLDALSDDLLEKEFEASSIREEYFQEMSDMIALEIGIAALESKKMRKAILKNDLAVMALGDYIYNDDDLCEIFEDICLKNDKKPKKKKKSK